MINFSLLNTNVINNSPKLNFKSNEVKTNICAPLSMDVFIRTNKTPSFGSNSILKPKDNSFESFEKWASETNFLDKIEDIVDKTGIILGSGYEGTVYEIDDCDEWVIKKYEKTYICNNSIDKPTIIKLKDSTPDINVGQAIAKVCIPSPRGITSLEYYILKKQMGESCAIDQEIAMNESNIKTEKHIDYLKKVAQMPQSTFEELIKITAYLSEKKIKLDCYNPSNLMIDSENKKINIVDTENLYQKENVQHGDVLYSLLDFPYTRTLYASDNQEKIDEAEKISFQIIDKFFAAMKNTKEKIYDTYYIDSLLNSKLMYKYLDTTTVNESKFKLSEMGLYFLEPRI